ncbi:MAG: hypothetical protein ACYTAO_10725 [Planctomycetota bacterium]
MAANSPRGYSVVPFHGVVKESRPVGVGDVFRLCSAALALIEPPLCCLIPVSKVRMVHVELKRPVQHVRDDGQLVV